MVIGVLLPRFCIALSVLAPLRASKFNKSHQFHNRNFILDRAGHAKGQSVSFGIAELTQ